MVEYPKYNNIALGKSFGGALEDFGKEIGANVWTDKTDKIFTSMYDLIESRSFERNITEVLNETINQNEGKILFDITGVNIQKAINGGLVHTPKLVSDGFITELELQMIMRNESWFNKVIFHEAGKVLTKEEIISKSIKFIK